eukprot:s1627_g7.t1
MFTYQKAHQGQPDRTGCRCYELHDPHGWPEVVVDGFHDGGAVADPHEPVASSNDEKGNSLWNILPSFDPASDDPKEYVDKVKFLHAICPQKDRSMLAPRLAMLMKGTAWAQIKLTDAQKLSDPVEGINVLLAAVSTWEEAAEHQTYEKFLARDIAHYVF